MEPVARRLLGEPNAALSTRDELRWGTNGSMAVKNGMFFNHEAKQGGGVVLFVEQQLPIDHLGAWRWLRDEFPQAFPQQLNGHGVGRRLNISKAYPYEDEQRVLLFQVCRTTPKGFVQRRPDPTAESGWDWHTRGVRQVPYRLPELLADIAAGRLIWIVEGEKDVDRLRDAGLAATCNAGGAGKWRTELSVFFKGADVVVVADNDPQAKDREGQLLWHADGRPQLPGQDHAAHVAGQLSGRAARVRVLDLGLYWADCPPKGDASDFLDAGKTAADLEALAAALPDWGPSVVIPKTSIFTADVLASIPVPQRQWHVEGLVPSHTVTLLGGDGGVGKSTLALQLCCATVAGLDWLGFKPRLGRALYISCEDDRDELHRRLDHIALHYGLGLDAFAGLKLWSLASEDAVLVLGQPGQPLQDTSRWAEFKAMVTDWAPALVVIDSLADVYGANENDRSLVRGFVRMLIGIAAACAGAVMLLAHPSLSGLSSGSGLSGSTAWNNSVRSRLYLTTPPSEDGVAAATDLRVLQVKKANYGPAGGDLVVRYSVGAFVPDEPAAFNALDQAVAADRIEQQFVAMLNRFNAQRRVVSHQMGRNYAPALFAQEPDARGTTMAAFRAAMTRLFAADRIGVLEEGPSSKRRARLVVSG